MISRTFLTAFRTPWPPYLFLSPSRSSTASLAPVEAPDGTAARPTEPSTSTTSTSIVGLLRESRIWRASIRSIVVIVTPWSPAFGWRQSQPWQMLLLFGWRLAGFGRRYVSLTRKPRQPLAGQWLAYEPSSASADGRGSAYRTAGVTPCLAGLLHRAVPCPP